MCVPDSSRSPNQSFATVVVGKGEKRFVIQQNLLIHYSKYFQAVLNKQSAKSKDKTITLGEEDPATFEFFIHWLYYQRFPDKKNNDTDELVDAWSRDVSDSDNDKGDTKSCNLINLHVFGTKYDIPQLKKDTLDEYFYHFQKDDTSLPPIDAIRTAFDNLEAKAPLCQLLIDIQCCCKQHENWTEETSQWYPTAFLLGTLRRYAAIVQEGKQKRWWKLDLCDYHNHVTEEECLNCKKEQRRWKKENR